MRMIFISIIIGFIQFRGNSQGIDTIKVSNDIELVKISESVYIHISYMEMDGYGRVPANGMLLVSNNEAFLFDTPWTDSLTNDLLEWIMNIMHLKIVGFITNDWHWDSMGGLALINDLDIPTYANEMTIDLTQKKGLPIPKIGFKDSLELNFRNFKINCYYFGPAHTMDNIIVWIPSEKVLFADCMIKELSQEDLGFTGDGDTIAYPKTLKKVCSRFSNAKFVIPGHGKCGGYELLTHTMGIVEKQ